MIPPTLARELDALGVLPRAKPTPKPATGPIKTVRNEKDVDW